MGSRDIGLGLALATLLCTTNAFAQTPREAPMAGADPLLAIDQHRATVIERIVKQWGEPLAQSSAMLGAEQLGTMLGGLRADQLLAASLAGSLTGLRDVLANALTGTRELRHAKALGDAAADLVYTPVVPCRIVDTRSGAGGIFFAGNQRNWLAFSAGGFAAQGGSATNCGISVRPAAVMMNVTLAGTVGGPEFFTAWPFNQARPNASAVNWTGAGQQPANAEIVPLCVGGGCTFDFSAYASGQTHVIIDVLGYFKAPGDGTALNILANGQRVMRYESNANSPNVIGGFSGNSVKSGAHGATIGGGGSGGFVVPGSATNCSSPAGVSCNNTVADSFGTVGGGIGNRAGDGTFGIGNSPFATVAGGLGNLGDGIASTISGGAYNTVNGSSYAVIGGGHRNVAAQGATVVGGDSNTASGVFSTVLGCLGSESGDGPECCTGFVERAADAAPPGHSACSHV